MAYYMRKKLLERIVILFLTIISIFNLYPYIFLMIGSLKPDNEFYTSIFNIKSLTFSRYAEMYTMKAIPFIRAFWNSLFVSGVITICVIFFSAITGYAIAKLNFKGKKMLSNFVIFQWIFPSTGVGFVIIFDLLIKLKLLNTYTSMIISFIMSAWGVFLFSQFFKTIPNSIIESARIDGASEFKIVFKIMLPMAKAVVSILGIWTFMGRWNELMWDVLVIRKHTMMTLNQIISNFVLGGGGGDMPGLTFAATILLTMPILILFIVFRKRFIGGIAGGEGMKF